MSIYRIEIAIEYAVLLPWCTFNFNWTTVKTAKKVLTFAVI